MNGENSLTCGHAYRLPRALARVCSKCGRPEPCIAATIHDEYLCAECIHTLAKMGNAPERTWNMTHINRENDI
jgi:hypothetical protein